MTTSMFNASKYPTQNKYIYIFWITLHFEEPFKHIFPKNLKLRTSNFQRDNFRVLFLLALHKEPLKLLVCWNLGPNSLMSYKVIEIEMSRLLIVKVNIIYYSFLISFFMAVRSENMERSYLGKKKKIFFLKICNIKLAWFNTVGLHPLIISSPLCHVKNCRVIIFNLKKF